MYLIFSTILILFGNALCQICYNPDCPKLQPEKDFPLSDLSGAWYEIRRIDNDYEPNYNCSNVNYTVLNDDQIKADYNAVHSRSGAKVHWEFNDTRIWSKDQNNSTGFYTLRMDNVRKQPNARITILDIDDDDYCILCMVEYSDNKSNDCQCSLFVWVLSRQTTLNAKFGKTIDEALRNNSIPVDSFIDVNQKNCPRYT